MQVLHRYLFKNERDNYLKVSVGYALKTPWINRNWFEK